MQNLFIIFIILFIIFYFRLFGVDFADSIYVPDNYGIYCEDDLNGAGMIIVDIAIYFLPYIFLVGIFLYTLIKIFIRFREGKKMKKS